MMMCCCFAWRQAFPTWLSPGTLCHSAFYPFLSTTELRMYPVCFLLFFLRNYHLPILYFRSLPALPVDPFISSHRSMPSIDDVMRIPEPPGELSSSPSAFLPIGAPHALLTPRWSELLESATRLQLHQRDVSHVKRIRFSPAASKANVMTQRRNESHPGWSASTTVDQSLDASKGTPI